MKHAAATLGSGNLRLAVMLPEGEDLNEWVAVNSKLNIIFISIRSKHLSFSFSCWFFQSNQHVVRDHHRILYRGELSHHVGRTKVRISLGRWSHGEKAYQMLSTQIHRLLNDLGAGSIGRRDSISIQNRWLYNFLYVFSFSSLIPNRKLILDYFLNIAGVPFPKNFLSIAKTILKRLFRVYAHIYHQHFSEVVQLGEEAHLNTSFKHFIFFCSGMQSYLAKS